MSPKSITETIRRLEDEKKREEQAAARRAQNEADRISRQKQAEQERIQREERRKEEAKDTARNKREQYFQKSGVFDGIKEIEREFLSFIRHNVVLHDYGSDHSEINLVWGARYKIEDGRVTYDHGLLGLGEGVEDYSCISAVVDNKGSLTIGGAHISRTQWEVDKDLVVEALGRYFVNPSRVVSRESDYSSSSSSTSTECCHS